MKRALCVAWWFGLPACSDHTVAVHNATPEAWITSHADGDQVLDGEETTFIGIVSDNDATYDELSVIWQLGGEVACESTTPEEDGATTCDIVMDSNKQDVTLVVSDQKNSTGLATVTLDVVVTEAPIPTITSPIDTQAYYTDQKISFAANVVDPDNELSELTLWWESDLEGVLELDTTPDANGDINDYGYLTEEGQHYLVLTAEDSYGKTGESTVLVTVGGPNNSPSCEITAPVSGTAGEEGEMVSLEATVSDSDVDADALQAVWSSDKDGEIGDSDPSSDGEVIYATDALSVGSHTITLTVTDDAEATCSDIVVYMVSTDPEVTVLTPEDGETYHEEQSIEFTATIADNEDSPDDLSVLWSSDTDGDFNTDSADSSGSIIFYESGLSPGNHVITVLVTDSAEMTATEKFGLTINGLPSTPEIALSPDPATTEDELVVAVTSDSEDPDDDDVSYAYEWSVDGVVSSSHTSTSVDADDTSAGETWSVTVTPTDALGGEGESVEAEVEIQNTAPQLSDVTLSPEGATTEDDIDCEPGDVEDPDDDTHTYSYTWTVSEIDLSETSATLDASYFERDDTVVCTVVVNDGTDDADAVSSDAMTIENTPPEVGTVTIEPDEPDSPEEVTCSWSDFDDADEDDEDESSAEWFINGSSVGTGTTLDSEYIGGDTITCTVTPYDGLDEGDTVSDSVVALNTPPVLDSVSLTPTEAYEIDTLECEPGDTTDEDGTTSFTYTYAWSVDGDDPGVTDSELDGDYFDRDQEVFCTITPNDGAEDGDSVDSDTVTISNSVPELDEVTLDPDPAYESDTLTCTPGTTTDDDSIDDVSYIIEWDISGAITTVTTSSTASIDGDDFSRGDEVTCTVTPDDGTDEGDSVSSEMFTIWNSAPSIESVEITPDPATGNDDLTCTWSGYSDDDDDDDNSTLVWTVNDTEVGTESTLAGGEETFVDGDTVACIVTPDDGDDVGDAVTAEIDIENAPPILDAVTLSPDPAYEGDTVLCELGSTEDVDGTTSFTYTYEWSVDGSDPGITDSELTSDDFDRDDEVICTVVANDGTDDGDPVSSEELTISNTPPVLDEISVSATSVTVDETIEVTVGETSDADEDSVTTPIEWRVDGDLVAETGTSLDGATYLEKGHTVVVTVTPNDGTDDGEALSETIEVINSPPETPVVAIEPSEPSVSDDLVCAGSATDADDDDLTYSYAWEVDGDAFSDATTTTDTDDTVGSSDTRVLEEWTCTVTVSDDEEEGESASVTVTIQPASFAGWDSTSIDLGDAEYEFVGEVAGDRAGYAVASAGDVDGDGGSDIIIGAYGNDDSETGAGKAYVLLSSSFGSESSIDLGDADYQFYGEESGDSVGAAVASAGDVDGDGLSDLLIAGPKNDDGATDAGKIYLVMGDSLGSTTDFNLTGADYTFSGVGNGDYAGDARSISTAGDVDGDELDDLIFGSYGGDGSYSNNGMTYLFFASTLGASTDLDLEDADITIEGEASQDYSGFALGGGHDVDGDGLADWVVSAHLNDDGGNAAGKAYLFFGAGFSSDDYGLEDADYSFVGENAKDYAGHALALASDVDGDGLGDVLIGAYGNDDGGSGSGISYLLLSSSLDSTSEIDLGDADYTFVGESSSDRSGVTVGFAGDVDGDLLEDVLVGSDWDDDGGTNAGKAYLVLSSSLAGSSNIDLVDADYAFTGEVASDYAGYALSGAGDVDGNGLSDLLVGAYSNDDNGAVAGKAYLLLTPDE